LEDLSYKEIADIMECPAGTVMSRLYRGRKMLQKQLSDYTETQHTETQQAEPASEPSEVVDFESFRRKKQEGGRA
jgi:RNA polymerase sigma-70 factor (ECF subfamily)